MLGQNAPFVEPTQRKFVGAWAGGRLFKVPEMFKFPIEFSGTGG